MSGSDQSLYPRKSRITVFDEPMICEFCSNDVFIPYEMIMNVEQPGIGVYHVRYIAICQLCGEAKHFGDPSDFDAEKNAYIWALKQFFVSVPTYRIKISFYVSKKNKKNINSYINKLKQGYDQSEVVNRKEWKNEVELQMKVSAFSGKENIKHNILYHAKLLRLNIQYIKIE